MTNPHTHNLKLQEPHFTEVLRGRKTHDIRRCDDRHFKVGDKIILHQFDPDKGYSGVTIMVEITNITEPKRFGLPEFVCVMSIRRVDKLK